MTVWEASPLWEKMPGKRKAKERGKVRLVNRNGHCVHHFPVALQSLEGFTCASGTQAHCENMRFGKTEERLPGIKALGAVRWLALGMGHQTEKAGQTMQSVFPITAHPHPFVRSRGARCCLRRRRPQGCRRSRCRGKTLGGGNDPLQALMEKKFTRVAL